MSIGTLSIKRPTRVLVRRYLQGNGNTRLYSGVSRVMCPLVSCDSFLIQASCVLRTLFELGLAGVSKGTYSRKLDEYLVL